MAEIHLGYKPNGRPDRRYIYGKTPDEVIERRDEFQRKVNEGFIPPKGKGHTVETWLTHWLHKIKKLEVRETTWHQGYRPRVENNIIPALGRTRLTDLTEEHIEDWKAARLKENAPSTVLAEFRILSAALKVAVRRRLIHRNPCDFVDPPRQDEEEPLPPERDEVRIILDALEHRRNGTRWALALALGPRRGECLGLTWPCVDLTDLNAATVRIAWELVRVPWQHGCEDPHACGAKHHVYPCPPDPADCAKAQRRQGTRHVCRTAVCKKDCRGEHQGRCIRKWCEPGCARHAVSCPKRWGGGLVMTEPKSKKSRRTVTLPRPLAERLVLHRMAQAAEREDPLWQGWGHDRDECDRRPRPREIVCPKCRKPIKKDALVFTQPNGMPINPSEDWREWSALLEELGLPHYRPHDGRHFSATVQLEEGIDVRVVQETLGHSSSDFTRKRYQHVTTRLQRDAAEKIGEALWVTGDDYRGEAADGRGNSRRDRP